MIAMSNKFLHGGMIAMETAFEMTTLEQLRAFSHPVRYQVINLLIMKPMTGSQLARALKMPRQRLHYHLKILREAGLILPVEDHENQGPVEIYYRAVAENFASALLTGDASADAAASQNGREQNGLRSRSLREISLTMIEQVKWDLNRPDILNKLSDLSSPFQHAVFLTPQEVKAAHERFQEIKNDLLQQAEKNLASGEREDFINIRYTLLVTPSYIGDEE